MVLLLLPLLVSYWCLNKTNKQAVIDIIAEDMSDAGISVVKAKADADYLIVKTAVDCAEHHDTIVVGQDTDLLVLLCYHAQNTRFNHIVV